MLVIYSYFEMADDVGQLFKRVFAMKDSQEMGKTDNGTLWAPLAMMGAAFLVFVGVAIIPSSDTSDLVVIFPPGTPFDTAAMHISNAGGYVIDTGAFDNILITKFDQGWSWANLREAGVVLVLSAQGSSTCIDRSKGLSPFAKQI